MRETFEIFKFRRNTLELIAVCKQILEDYASEGYDLTLRQLYYQLVSRAIIPNKQAEYQKLGVTINRARLSGLIDWNNIVDRGRHTSSNSHWKHPGDILQSCIDSFMIDKWADQPNYVEVMCEKQALEGVLEPVCSELDIPFSSNKGYSSASFMYRKGKTLHRKYNHRNKSLHVLYFGDHDPSGLDMDRDIKERLELFSGARIYLYRLALTMDQIEEYDPPPNPAKLTDTRADAYIAEHGYTSWELDALEPRKLASLVKEKVAELRDDNLWSKAVRREVDMIEQLEEVKERFDEDYE